MAYISSKIYIPETASAIPVDLYFPTDLPAHVGNEVKGVITLLHGLGNSSQDWMRLSAACRYAADNGYILVAPDAANSFYHNMAFGPPWYTILTELLPAQLNRIFNIPSQRDINYIAGLSMGGYGALRIGLSQPQRFAAVGSFSGTVHLSGMMAEVKADPEPQYRPLFVPVFGEDLDVPQEADLFYLAQKVSALPKAQQPRLYCTCGTRDTESGQILMQNHAFRDFAASLPLDYTYQEWDGVHEWNFWDRSLAQFIGFIQNSSYGQRKQGDWSAPLVGKEDC